MFSRCVRNLSRRTRYVAAPRTKILTDIDKERFSKLKENKKKFMSKLLSTMDKVVFDEVSNDQNYRQIIRDFNLLGL